LIHFYKRRVVVDRIKMSRLTCLTCQVGFTDSDLHRLHFKGDWHRYNLKRKVANLPVVSSAQFQERKDAHEKQAKIESGVKEEEPGNYCIACRKSFSGLKAYNNHLNSKKHREMVLKFGDQDVNRIKEKAKAKAVVEEESDDEDMEEVDSDEWDEFEDDPIPANDCLFCAHHSANIDNNVKHMVEAHSFFIPDAEYLSNLDGLLEYLGSKVGQGHMCLWCSERSKAFQSVDAVQKHMVDKGHCKLKHEGESLIEYAEYYDYSTSYPDAEGSEEGTSANQEEEVELDSLDDTGYQLTLPSGATIGHRSLVRYYRQSLNPNRELVIVDKSAKGRVLSTYRAMGWTGASSVEVAKKVRDIKFMNRVRNKQHMQLGWRANRLQTHFRDRNGMCQ